MYVVTFTQDTPEGFDTVSIDRESRSADDCMKAITKQYCETNFPLLEEDSDDYFMKRAGYDYNCTSGEKQFKLDKYSIYDYSFTLSYADFMKQRGLPL